MRYPSGASYLEDSQKSITIIGLSGVGKTTVAQMVSPQDWFHYSIDYRIGTHYLNDEINDLFKTKALELPFFADLLRHNAVSVRNRTTMENLYAISAYLGMLGDPTLGGVAESSFRERLAKHGAAETASMKDIEIFRRRATQSGQSHLIVDTSGSLCEIVDVDDTDDPILKQLEASTLVIYIESDESHDHVLAERQKADPKPLFYRSEFLDTYLAEYCKETGIRSVDKADPKELPAWLFPRLIAERRLRYQKIASRIAYTISMDDIFTLNTEQEFMELIADTIDASS
jgi:hypothetical protein